MIVIGHVFEAWVEIGRVYGLAHLDFDTHHGNYRLDLTPPPSDLNLDKFAKSCIGLPVHIDFPVAFVDPQGTPLNISIGVTK